MIERIDVDKLIDEIDAVIITAYKKKTVTQAAIVFKVRNDVRNIMLRMVRDESFFDKMINTAEAAAFGITMNKSMYPAGWSPEDILTKSVLYILYPVSDFYMREAAFILARKDEYGAYIVLSSYRMPRVYKVDKYAIIIGNGSGRRMYAIIESRNKIVGYGFVTQAANRKYKSPAALARYLARAYKLL